MDKLRALILHPEPQVRFDLREALSGVDFLRVVGEAVTAFEAIELLEAIAYGVVFVGVDLPGGVGGIELVQMLHQRKMRPAVVFLAADESSAYKAFELEALDYLVWPSPPDRLNRTVDRIRQFRAAFAEAPVPEEKWQEAEPDAPAGEPEQTVKVDMGEEDEEAFLAALKQAWDFTQRGKMPEIEKLAVNQDGRHILVPYDQIIFVEAFEDYSYVHTANNKFLTSYRLKHLEDRLKMHRFFRVHRKYLVNLDMVTEIASLPGSNFMLRTAGRTRIELPVGRRRVAELKQILGL